MRIVMDRDRGIIIELTLAGISAHNIAGRIGWCLRTVGHARKHCRETDSRKRKPGSGQPKATTSSDDRYLGSQIHVGFELLFEWLVIPQNIDSVLYKLHKIMLRLY